MSTVGSKGRGGREARWFCAALWLAGLGAGVAGCPAARPPEPGAPGGAASAGARGAIGTPSGAASTSGSVAAVPASGTPDARGAGAPVVAALEPSPFALVAQGPALLVLEPLGSAAALRAGSRLAIAEGATLRLEDALGAALPFDGVSDEACAGSLFGRWPDAVWWATDRGPKHRGALAQRRGTRWERVKEARVYHSYEALLEVAPDAWVAVVNSNSWCNPEGPVGRNDAPTKRDCGDMPTEGLQYFEELPGRRGALPLAPSGTLPGAGASATDDCRPLYGALAALTTGEIFGAYAGCHGDRGRHAVSLQSNAPNGSRRSASALLPGVPERNVFRETLIAVSASEAYIGLEIGPVYDATTPYLAAFDGQAWREIALPFARGIEAAVRGRDGALWLVAGTHAKGELWRRTPAGMFVPVALPLVDGRSVIPISVWLATDETLWLVAKGPACTDAFESCERLVYRSGPAPERVLALPARCPEPRAAPRR